MERLMNIQIDTYEEYFQKGVLRPEEAKRVFDDLRYYKQLSEKPDKPLQLWAMGCATAAGKEIGLPETTIYRMRNAMEHKVINWSTEKAGNYYEEWS